MIIAGNEIGSTTHFLYDAATRVSGYFMGYAAPRGKGKKSEIRTTAKRIWGKCLTQFPGIEESPPRQLLVS
ncbi:hypothetical protein BDV26DRAFT_265094 [Aspergillus bertholletiae]|uniref:Uncharacterized protein n=1 Tax=Aspergillus bertholletiae TaxID=1226010 RepID=A0A5N7B608_9EURO|nr:hypothetical protein BDV26DRAFT_265094 [Aspergillus bertholletiae]